MDTRYLLAALLVFAFALWLDYANWTNSAAVWSLPFALILLFLALAGPPPRGEVVHFYPEAPLEVGGQPEAHSSA